jgi:hypothetical protein
MQRVEAPYSILENRAYVGRWVGILTVKTEHNTKLLESSWSQPSAWQRNLVCR